MLLKILLINPWIYDFAAVNLWSRPLGILKVAEYLSRFNVDLSLIDCTDVFKLKSYGIGKYPKEIIKKPDCIKAVPRKFGRYGISIDDFKEAVKKSQPFDLVLITSIMSYWYPGIQTAVEIVRSVYKNAPIILGGIYATLWHKHASFISGADFIYKGPVNDGIKFVFKTFGFRIKEQREERPYYKLNLYNNYPFAPLLTSTGCPYNCSYCSSRILNEGFIQRRADEVIEEVKELCSIGVREFAFYDDALLVNADSHIKAILKEIIRYNINLRFHCPNGLHARFIEDELAFLLKQSGFKTLRLSLETINEQRQKNIGNKVTSEELVHAVKILKKNGFTKKDIGVYLMYGLPGQELDEVKEAIEFVKKLNVRINLTEFSPIPQTKCWEELVAKGIISNDIDPLLTNNTVFSYLFSGYDMAELKKLKLGVKIYR